VLPAPPTPRRQPGRRRRPPAFADWSPGSTSPATSPTPDRPTGRRSTSPMPRASR
jgi:hypothetical protein